MPMDDIRQDFNRDDGKDDPGSEVLKVAVAFGTNFSVRSNEGAKECCKDGDPCKPGQRMRHLALKQIQTRVEKICVHDNNGDERDGVGITMSEI